MLKEGDKRVPEREGVIFLLYKDGKVLLEKRLQPDKAYFGYNLVPGGKKEGRDLTFEQAATREVIEECGVIPKRLIHLDTFLCVSISNHLYNTTAFLIPDFEGEVVNVEGKSEHLWVNFDEAEKLLEFVETKYVLRMAKDFLINEGLLGG